MVDRPIKKSDREAAQQTNPSDDKPKAARSTPKPVKKADRTDGDTSAKRDERDERDERGRGGKGRGKGRGRGKDDAPRTPMNPALMRGPKPTKKVEEVVEAAAEETIADDTAAEETVTENTSVDTTEPEAVATNET